MSTPDARRQIIREAIREARAARNEDTRRCECGCTASSHLIRLADGAVFHCCTEGCGCKQYAESAGEPEEGDSQWLTT